MLSVFLMALITISNIMNQGNTDMTIEMAQAVYPVVSVDYNGYSLNQMHGYAQAMEVSQMRESIQLKDRYLWNACPRHCF